MSQVYSRMDPAKVAKLADVLKTIAHPVRLSIIEILFEIKALSVSELMDNLNIEQSLLSHHLTKMKDRNILTAKREGKNIFYSLEENSLIKIFDCLDGCDLLN